MFGRVKARLYLKVHHSTRNAYKTTNKYVKNNTKFVHNNTSSNYQYINKELVE